MDSLRKLIYKQWPHVPIGYSLFSPPSSIKVEFAGHARLGAISCSACWFFALGAYGVCKPDSKMKEMPFLFSENSYWSRNAPAAWVSGKLGQWRREESSLLNSSNSSSLLWSSLTSWLWGLGKWRPPHTHAWLPKAPWKSFSTACSRVSALDLYWRNEHHSSSNTFPHF